MSTPPSARGAADRTPQRATRTQRDLAQLARYPRGLVGFARGATFVATGPRPTSARAPLLALLQAARIYNVVVFLKPYSTFSSSSAAELFSFLSIEIFDRFFTSKLYYSADFRELKSNSLCFCSLRKNGP